MTFSVIRKFLSYFLTFFALLLLVFLLVCFYEVCFIEVFSEMATFKALEDAAQQHELIKTSTEVEGALPRPKRLNSLVLSFLDWLLLSPKVDISELPPK